MKDNKESQIPQEFGKCIVNFTRGSAHKNRTIAQVSAMYKVKKK